MKKATLPKGRSPQRPAKRLPSPRSPKALPIANVLVPLDFSASSKEALEFALPLLRWFGANLHLAHIFEPDYPLASMVALPLIVPELEIGKRVRRHLKDVARKYAIELRPENIHAVKGRPFEEICHLARNCAIDLIVTATRGNTGLKHLTLGSTAERVVRYSPCPVLVVRGGDRKRKAGDKAKSQGALTFRKILVPIDFSDCSIAGLTFARALSKQFDSKLILLNAVPLQYAIASDEYARYDYPLLLKQGEKAAEKQMHDLIRKTAWEGIAVQSSLQIGHAGEQICAHAESHGADLIVTSTHGRTGLRHILIGSTAEYVVRHASCPVLVVPSHERTTPAATTGRK